MRTALSIIAIAAGLLTLSQEKTTSKVSLDEEILGCFKVAYEKQKEIVREKKFQPIENYWVDFMEKDKDVLISFSPKIDEGTGELVVGGVSSKGLGYQYLVEK